MSTQDGTNHAKARDLLRVWLAEDRAQAPETTKALSIPEVRELLRRQAAESAERRAALIAEDNKAMTDERDPAAARLQEIGERLKQTAAWFTGMEMSLVLDQLQSAHARAATLEQQLAQRTAERDEARHLLSTAAQRINCAGPVHDRIDVLRRQLTEYGEAAEARAEAAEARVRALEEQLDAVIVKWRERGHPPKPRGWMHRITIPEVLQCADELQAGIDDVRRHGEAQPVASTPPEEATKQT
jgi:chromosome segregation ATPase